MIPFSPPHIDDKIINEVVATLKSGWITTGPRTKLFEKKISEFCGISDTLAVSSATAGLELVLRWYGVKEGDEVILPAYTYAATANVIIHCGAKPVFVDTNKLDFNISIEKIKSAITERTKVIMPVDFAGLPCDYNEINELVNSTKQKDKFKAETEEQKKLGRILVLSDAAHSLGATYNGKKTGSLTDITVFSFHAVKNLTTSEGGAILFNLPHPFNNNEVYKWFSIIGLHGQNKDALAKTKIGNWKYDIITAGYKANMTDIAASIGLIELERYEKEILTKRKSIFTKYSEAFKLNKHIDAPIYKQENKISSYHVYALRLNNTTVEQRDEIMQKIFAKGVSVNVHFIPVPMMTFYKSLGYNIDDYPVAKENFEREISLPVYYTLSKENQVVVINAVIESINEILG